MKVNRFAGICKLKNLATFANAYLTTKSIRMKTYGISRKTPGHYGSNAGAFRLKRAHLYAQTRRLFRLNARTERTAFLTAVFLVALATLPLQGQQTSYLQLERIHNNTESSITGCFLQDPSGLVWFGSNAGLLSYDGYTAHSHFTYGTKSNVRIYCGIRADDFFYLGTDNGVLVYNYKTDSYQDTRATFPTDVRCIVRQNDRLWLGTFSGLFRYDLKTEEIRRFTPQNSLLPHQAVYSLLPASDSTLYIGTYNGLCRLNPHEERFERVAIDTPDTRKNLFVNALLEDTEDQCLWIGTEGELVRYDMASGETKKIESFRHNSVKSLAFDSEKNLLLGTDNGLYVFNKRTLKSAHLRHDSRNAASLPNNIVWSLFADANANVWIGTDNGIALAKNTRHYRFIPIWQLTDNGEGNRFYSILRDSKGCYWMGGTDGLLQLEHLDKPKPQGKWFKMNTPYPLSHNRIRHIYEDSEKDLWIATDGSIERYDRRTGQFVHYFITDSTRTYNANWAYCLFEDKEQNLWISTCLGGLFCVSKQNLKNARSGYCIADKSYTSADGLKTMFINQIVQDKTGCIWMLLYNNGIQKLDPAADTITTFEFPEALSGVRPDFLMGDKEGAVWIGCRNRILKVDPETEQTETVMLEEADDCGILSMAEVENSVWVSTTKGLWIIRKDGHDASRLRIADRLFTSLYYDARDKQVILGGNDGAGICIPSIVNETGQETTPVRLTAIYVNNRPFTTRESIRYSREIELKHTENNLILEFSDLPYSQVERKSFAYKLEGLDTKWHLERAYSNRIVYNNLPYGNYRLAIKDTESGKETDNLITVRILPPWYYTVWAKISYMLLGGALIAWIINFFVVKNRLRLERTEKKQILEQSRRKINFLSNISHDLKTPVSMIVAPVSKLILDVKDTRQKEMLESVYRNAMSLNSMIHRLLDFNRIDSKEDSLLITSRIELVSRIKNIYMTFSEADTEKNHQWEFASDTETLYMNMDAVKLDSIIDNLLSNARKYTPAHGTISVKIHCGKDNETVSVTVSDTGIGIPQSELPYIFQRFFQSSRTKRTQEGTGIGLYLVKTYTEMHQGSVSVASTDGEGTSFCLTFPVDKSINLPHAESAQDKDTGKPSLLIVDDNAEMRDMIGSILSAQYRCTFASNGKEALSAVEASNPDLIISDFVMPVMNGIEMSDVLKKNLSTATIPIILLTAKDDRETLRESLQSKIDAFVTKPFDAELLQYKVAQLLENKAMYAAKAKVDSITTPKEPEGVVSQDEKFLAGITQLIEDHISDSDLNVNALSELSGIGGKQIYRKLKQLTGMSPVEYIKSVRMKKAAMLLKQKKFSVSEVMYMAGYSNPSYFSKCFQAAFGKTPKQYLAETDSQ